MDRLIYISMTGAKALTDRQAVTANNLANLNTPGFKAAIAAARTLPVYGNPLPTRAYAVSSENGFNPTEGALQTTGRPLDVALNGAGWLVFEDPAGKPALSRDGRLQLGQDGVLRGANGYPVLGQNDAQITLPPLARVLVDEAGRISGVPLDQPDAPPQVLAQLKRVNPETDQVHRDVDGLFRSRAPLVDAEVRVQGGALESSNASPMQAMLELIEQSREFESQIKVITTEQRMAQKSSRIMEV